MQIPFKKKKKKTRIICLLEHELFNCAIYIKLYCMSFVYFHTILALLRHYQYSTILQEIFNRNITKQLLYYILLLKPLLF